MRFFFGPKASEVEQFPIRPGVNVDGIRGRVKGILQQQHEEDAKQSRCEHNPCLTPLMMGNNSEDDPSKTTVTFTSMWKDTTLLRSLVFPHLMASDGMQSFTGALKQLRKSMAFEITSTVCRASCKLFYP
ncbi:hypothetical protein DPMN_103818 [Dreissena polymorpha]|uniref:Uncharacterized protein n=1 Tax=Dreissena polymorpha TaxID=45954 RepID=A0A9D4H8K8_DREPO|nr:hypothetical protein DPMN_103818 [Dreissena polymorpha]